MSFSCTLVGGSIRSVSRTLTCLSRIGGEVTLEATSDKLLLRTLAVSHAAYALVTLRADLFERDSFVNLDARGVPLSSQSEPSPVGAGFVKCKLLLKHLLMAFRHTHHVDRMEWNMQTAHNCLTINMQAGGIRSTYRVPFETQSNILQADFPRSSSLNVLQFKASLMLQCLEPFPAKLSELTLMMHAPDPNDDSVAAQGDEYSITLRGGAEAAVQGMLPGGVAQVQQAAMTEITMPHSQIEHIYLPPGDVDLTFNVKEVRAFLQYCDALAETDCRVSFGGTGSPMLLETVARHAASMHERSDDPHLSDDALPLKMELVVATLAESQTQSQAQSPAATPQSVGRQQAQVQHANSQSPAHSQQQPQATLSQGAQSQAFLQKQSAAPIRVVDEGETVPPTP